MLKKKNKLNLFVYTVTNKKRVLECKDADEDKYCEVHKQTLSPGQQYKF